VVLVFGLLFWAIYIRRKKRKVDRLARRVKNASIALPARHTDEAFIVLPPPPSPQVRERRPFDMRGRPMRIVSFGPVIKFFSYNPDPNQIEEEKLLTKPMPGGPSISTDEPDDKAMDNWTKLVSQVLAEEQEEV